MTFLSPFLRAVTLTLFALACLNACTVVKVVDAAASTAIGVTKGAVKATGAVAGAVIPDGDDDDKKDED